MLDVRSKGTPESRPVLAHPADHRHSPYAQPEQDIRSRQRPSRQRLLQVCMGVHCKHTSKTWEIQLRCKCRQLCTSLKWHTPAGPVGANSHSGPAAAHTFLVITSMTCSEVSQPCSPGRYAHRRRLSSTAAQNELRKRQRLVSILAGVRVDTTMPKQHLPQLGMWVAVCPGVAQASRARRRPVAPAASPTSHARDSGCCLSHTNCSPLPRSPSCVCASRASADFEYHRAGCLTSPAACPYRATAGGG